MATNGEGTSSAINQNTENTDPSDRLKRLYPVVNEDETPLPRTWNPRTKSTFIGLSQNNLRLHYKGMLINHSVMTNAVKTLADDSLLLLVQARCGHFGAGGGNRIADVAQLKAVAMPC